MKFGWALQKKKKKKKKLRDQLHLHSKFQRPIM